MIPAVAWPQTKASDRSHPTDAASQLEAQKPAHPIAPAQRGLPGQVPPPAPFDVAYGHAHAVEDFRARTRLAHLSAQRQGEDHDGVVVGPQEAIELAPIRQCGEGRTQMAPRVAIKGAFAGKLAPLAPSAPR